jgi:hypothetical protein
MDKSELEELLKFVQETTADEISVSDVDRAVKQESSLEERFEQAKLFRYNQDTQHRNTVRFSINHPSWNNNY